jgi:hypothetical protein
MLVFGFNVSGREASRTTMACARGVVTQTSLAAAT